MTAAAILTFFVAFTFGASLAQDCSGKIQTFHKCLADYHDKDDGAARTKSQTLELKLNACYTIHGCTPPTKSHNDRDVEERVCLKSFNEERTKKYEECMKKTDPSVRICTEQAAGEEHCDYCLDSEEEQTKELEKGCAKKEQVHACLHAEYNNSQPSDNEMRTLFQDRCKNIESCWEALGAECQAHLDKAVCVCYQQLHQQADQIRSGIQACNKKQRTGTVVETHQVNCDTESKKNYCKLGYDVYVQDKKLPKKPAMFKKC